jgi:hypothetical protein
MADVQRIYWDAKRYAHTACLHWEGFLKILWDTLRIFHYRYPPQYKGCEFTEVGVPRCRATVTVPQHPILEWQSIEIEVVGYHLVDTFEAAALKAITTFCEQHPEEVAAYPIGLFPAVFAHDAKWICHTWFRKGNRMHPICAPGSSSAHIVDVTSEYPKQCINEKEYNSTLLHDQQS